MKNMTTVPVACLLAAALLAPAPAAQAADRGKPAQGSCRTGESNFFRDEALSVKLSSRLKFQKALFNEVIQVKVSGGVATLSGNVSTADQIRLAGKVAAETSGITCVNNFLKVGPPLPPASVQPGG